MAVVMPLNPRPFLSALLNDQITVAMKWSETHYHGRLVSADSYMNLQLAEAAETVAGEFKGNLGHIMIRCNNVLWVSARQEGFGAPAGDEVVGVKGEGSPMQLS